MKLRSITRADIRAMIINHQGWGPGSLDPADIKPLSEKALAHPLMKLIKKRNFREWKP